MSGPTDVRLSEAEAASGTGVFEYDLSTGAWHFSPGVATLFGLNPKTAPPDFEKWHCAIFADDLTKLRAAFDADRRPATSSPSFASKAPTAS